MLLVLATARISCVENEAALLTELETVHTGSAFQEDFQDVFGMWAFLKF